MQMTFDYGAVEDMAWVRDQLRSFFGRPDRVCARAPIGQLVKSSISHRTLDEVSLAAYRRLVEAYPEWLALAEASTGDVEALIGDVTFPDVKARHLGDALRAIAARHPDFDLEFLGLLGVAEALAWLERLPGVGRKVSASTLNFSTLDMPALVVDTHVLRVLSRYGFVRSNADIRTAYDAAMAASPRWSAAKLAELHILMKRLGQTTCRHDRAHCANCPIRLRCKAAAAPARRLVRVGGRDMHLRREPARERRGAWQE
jgi:endonuclease-3